MIPRATAHPAISHALRRKLLPWFDRNKRNLPWRKNRHPYPVWLSEMMLQQTQVATVIPYFNRFLARFPTVRDLAAAPLDDVLRLWAGLGYYARARNLHRAAQLIVRDHDGRFPQSPEALQSLPGVGRYSAGAVASIAFDARAPILDGNVARVLARLFDLSLDPRAATARARLWALAESLLPARRCGDFNQALMELGATLCTPGPSPNCPACPLRASCRALANDTITLRPRPASRKQPLPLHHVVAAIHHNNRFLFIRRLPTGLWANLWELPTTPLAAAANTIVAPASSRCSVPTAPPDRTANSVRALRSLLKNLSISAARISAQPFTQTTRQLTHRTITFTAHLIRLSHAPKNSPNPNARWLTLQSARNLPTSTAMKKILTALARARYIDR